MTSRLSRPLTVLELLQIQRMFKFNRGYKDLIRDFKHDFGLILDKPTAKRFITNRSWQEVLEWLTGEKIAPADAVIPELEPKKYELLDKLEQMIKVNKADEEERQQQLKTFEKNNYYFSEDVKYFNFPLYGEIITYKFKEPFIKCFLIDVQSHKISKIEDVPISESMPEFLLRIIRKVNDSKILTKKTFQERIEDNINTPYYVSQEEAEKQGLENIFDSELFTTYGFKWK